VRVTVPYVRVDHGQLFPGHKVIALHRIDRVGITKSPIHPRPNEP
jgi:hypothetical protein